MCPAVASTATPSGSLCPLTIVFFPEPSGFMERTRPPLRSKKNRRPEAVVDLDSVHFDFVTGEDIEFALLIFLVGYTKALKPVMALPTISVFISRVPSYEYRASASAK